MGMKNTEGDTAERLAWVSEDRRPPYCISQHQERADKAILSVESGSPADVALCGQRFSSVALRHRLWPGLPFNFLSIGFA